MTKDAKYIFLYLLYICMSSFKKCLLPIFITIIMFTLHSFYQSWGDKRVNREGQETGYPSRPNAKNKVSVKFMEHVGNYEDFQSIEI